MNVAQASNAVIRLYPKIYFACHRRHVRDPASGRLLSSHQISILDHVDDQAVTFVSVLAEHMGTTPSTISLALDRLAEGGYVRRVADKIDRRRVGVLLTKPGARIRDASSVLDPELVQDLVGKLTGSERAQAIHGLMLLANAAGDKGTAAAARGALAKNSSTTKGAEAPVLKKE